MMNRKKLLFVGVLLAFAGLGTWGYLHTRKGPAYQTATVERGDIQSAISATGACNAVVTVQVGSQVSGNIKALYADFNTKVKKDQVVALIDPALFEARVQQVRASLESARAAAANTEAMLHKADADIAIAKANAQNQNAGIARAKVAVADAKSKLDRRLALVNEGVLSKEDGDTAEAAYDSAVAELQAAQAQFDAAQQNIDAVVAQRKVAQTQLEAAQAQVRQNEATLRQAEVDLEHTRIVAPVDGTVVARRMDVGQTVAASFQAPTIFEIAQDLTKMQVDTNVDEADVGRVQVGQRANFSVDAYPGRQFPSQVAEIRRAPINNQNVITYDVVVTADNRELKLFPGMTANVKILVDERKNVLKIPNAALRFRPPENSTVHASSHGGWRGRTQQIYFTDKDGTLLPIAVQTGLSDGNFTEVSSPDLREGMQVAIAEPGRGGQQKGGGGAGRPRGMGF
jgi:HlyD family secretion protein